MSRGLLGAMTVTALLAVAGPAAAGAAGQKYAPGQQARDLNGGDGGWTATDTQAGPLGETLCIVAGVLICPSATSAHQPDGGATGTPGDGSLGADFSVIAGVAGSGTSVWESKSFVYRGVQNKKPKSVTFKAKRRSDLAQLLALPSSSATYTAEILPEGGGTPIAAGSDAIPATSAWAALPPQDVTPGDLKRGQSYTIRITSVYETGLVGVNEDGQVAYDDIALVAKSKGGGHATKRFRHQARKGLGPAVERGKHLFMKVGCPKSAAPDNCTIKVRALMHAKGPRATNSRRVGAAPGQRGFVRLKVRHVFRSKVAGSRHVWARAKFKAGPNKVTVLKRVRVRH